MIWLDILVLIVCAIALIRGYMTGLIMQIASLAGIILGAIFAGKMAEEVYPYLIEIFPDSQNIIAPLSYLVGFILILIAVYFIGKLIDKFAETVLLGTANKIVGAIFCMVKWILIISIMTNIVTMFDQRKIVLNEKVREESYTYSVLIDIAQTIIPYFRLDNFISKDIILQQEKKHSTPALREL